MQHPNDTQPTRRLALQAMFGTLCAGTVSTPAFAQSSWKPTRPVEIVIGVGPGGGTDNTARDVARLLKEHGFAPHGAIVNNKPGGGHAVALAYTIGQAGNPHLLQITGQIIVANNVLGRSQLSYKQVTPLAKLNDGPAVFAASQQSGIRTAQDLVARLKKDPSSVSFSISTGIGTTQHLSALQLGQQLGIPAQKIKAVSFNSSSEGVTAGVGGHVDIVITSSFALNPFVESGHLRYIAIGGDKRGKDLLKDIPTWKELGYDVGVPSSSLVVAPPKITTEQIAYWDKAFATITSTPEWKKILDQNQLADVYLDSKQTAAYFDKVDRDYRALLGDLLKK